APKSIIAGATIELVAFGTFWALPKPRDLSIPPDGDQRDATIMQSPHAIEARQSFFTWAMALHPVVAPFRRFRILRATLNAIKAIAAPKLTYAASDRMLVPRRCGSSDVSAIVEESSRPTGPI